MMIPNRQNEKVQAGYIYLFATLIAQRDLGSSLIKESVDWLAAHGYDRPAKNLSGHSDKPKLIKRSCSAS
ncbi:MAG: hypothetical protein COB46_08675 [Rhodospirillaceae bacterium]|nr:MAG: hypothetical protein COB46_08675 [Rhodospirillaceae bacterium]